MSKGTTHRTVRIEDGLWEQAKQAASERGDNLSAIIRCSLRAYIEENKTYLDAIGDDLNAGT